MEQVQTRTSVHPKEDEQEKLDPRITRSRRALGRALAEEIVATGDIARVTATAVAERSGLTRRTFYLHFRDINDLVEQVEAEALTELSSYIEAICAATLSEMVGAISSLEPAPGTVDLLEYIKENALFYGALLGEGGDQTFVEKIKAMIYDTLAPRALTGISEEALGAYFDYYLTYAISAEVGVLLRWLAGGMAESSEQMARIMTSLTFVRPGDLYGYPISFDFAAYGMRLADLQEDQDD